MIGEPRRRRALSGRPRFRVFADRIEVRAPHRRELLQLWRWEPQRFLFRLAQGRPFHGCAGAADCQDDERCDATRADVGVCVLIK